jgi:hypothetical protein
MPQWHLCANDGKLQTGGMPFPQSSSRPFSIRVVSLFILIALAALMPAGARAVTQQLLCSPSSLKFGTVPVGQSETQLVALTNTGQTSATISALSVSGSEFSVSGLNMPAVLAAGQSVTLNVVLAPTTNGWTGGKVTFASNASNSTLQLSVAGSGVVSDSVTASPSSLSFGQVAVGASATRSVVLTNARTWKETLKTFQIAGTGFSVNGPALPMTLSGGQSVTLQVSFTPQAAGVTGGSVLVAGPALNIPLTGSGTTSGQLTISPGALNFGSVLIGATGTQGTTLSATGGSVTISSVASSNAQYSLSGISFPLTIGAGQSAQFNVAFLPKSAGSDSATLSFSATNSQVTESLTGTGTAPQVGLTWLPSTSQVSGYNVYRGTAPGLQSKINTALDPVTAYTDTTVDPGTTYYYSATAVDSNGQESAFSTAAEIAVP